MLRKPLGRGLGALIADTSEDSDAFGTQHQVPDGGFLMLAVDEIAPAPYQPRKNFDPERLEELSRAIRSQGVIEPLVVRRRGGMNYDGAAYELIAGERRLRAAKSAGLATVPVVVREVDERTALEMSLVENLAREELSAIEEARAFVQLSAEFSLSHEEIASRIGKSRPYVSNTIRLLDLPPAVIEMIERSLLTPGQARPLLGLESADAQIAAARRIVADGISARGAEQIANLERRDGTGRLQRRSSPSTLDANLQALADSLQRALRRKVRIMPRRGSSPGRIEIDFYDDQDLTALASALSGEGTARSAQV